jgi:26S proteasome regulatory subunit N4
MGILVTTLTWRRVRNQSPNDQSALIDTKLVRTARARIICLKNDYKELMNEIEKGLHQHHASLLDSGGSKELQSPSTRHGLEGDAQTPTTTTVDLAFAKVNSVAPSSPAHEAGLKVGDRIKHFGPVHWGNHEDLRKVADVVQRSEGVGPRSSPHFICGLIQSASEQFW